MANGNAGDKRTFGVGGIVTIGAHTIKSIVAGSLEWATPGAAEMPQMDRGAIGDSLAGGDRPSTGKLTLHLSHLLDNGGGAGTIGALSLAGVVASNEYKNWDTANGKLKQLAIVIQIPKHKGASVGEKITFTKAIFPDGVKFSAGQDSGENFDTIEINFKDLAASPTVESY